MKTTQWVQLQEVAKIHGGGRLRLSGNDFVDSGFPAYGAGGINGFLPVAEYEDTTAIILSSIGARCGKCFYAEGSWTSIANTQVILPNPQRVDPKFLWFQLNDEGPWHRSGTGQPFIKPSDVKTRKVYLPPLEEQRRIGAILDQADAIRTKRRQALAHLDALTQSIFHEIFRSVHDTAPLQDLADVTSGITKGRRATSPLTPIPYLAVSNVQAGHLALDVVKEIEATAEEIERYRLRFGDVVLTEGGDPDKLGRGTLWQNEIPLCIHQNHIFRVRLNNDSPINGAFLANYLADRRARDYFSSCAKQTTGIASINKRQLTQLPVPIPNRIDIDRFEVAADQVTRYQKIHRQAYIETDSMFASLQSRAFRGEL